RETALKYIADGSYVWNAGMFFFRARRILDEIKRHEPALGKILDEIERDPKKTTALYAKAPKISIDYAVMEKSSGLHTAIVDDIGWSDVGSWAALTEVRAPDEARNTCIGETLAIDARENVLVSDGKILVAAVG